MMNRRPSFGAPRTLASIALPDQQNPGWGAPPETQGPFGKPVGGAETQAPFFAPPESQAPFYAPPETQAPFFAPPDSQGPFSKPMSTPDWNSVPQMQAPGWASAPPAFDPFNVSYTPRTLAGIARRGR